MKGKENVKAKGSNKGKSTRAKRRSSPAIGECRATRHSKGRNSFNTQLFAGKEKASIYVVLHDIFHLKPTELDAVDAETRPMSFHTTFPGFPAIPHDILRPILINIRFMRGFWIRFQQANVAQNSSIQFRFLFVIFIRRAPCGLELIQGLQFLFFLLLISIKD